MTTEKDAPQPSSTLTWLTAFLTKSDEKAQTITEGSAVELASNQPAPLTSQRERTSSTESTNDVSQLSLLVRASTDLVTPKLGMLASIVGLGRFLPAEKPVKKISPPMSDDPTENLLGRNLPEELTKPLPSSVQVTLQQISQEYQQKPKGQPLESLNRIAFTQEKLQEVKGSLALLVDSISENPSYLSAWSRAWGNTAQWKKILGGTVVTGIPLAVALTAHIPLLLTISGFVAVGYSATGFLLDNHYQASEIYVKKLKQGILSLADILAWTISSLSEISEELAREVGELKTQNSIFKEQNRIHAENINRLCSNMEHIKENIILKLREQEGLSGMKEALSTHLKALESHADRNEEQFMQSQRQLEEIDETYQLITGELGNYLGDLNQQKQELATEVGKLKTVEVALNDTNQMLTGIVLEDGEARKNFRDRLDKFISDKEESFASLTQQASTTGKQLVKTQEELERTKNELQDTQRQLSSVLQEQKRLVTSLERLERAKLSGVVPTMRTGRSANTENLVSEHQQRATMVM